MKRVALFAAVLFLVVSPVAALPAAASVAPASEPVMQQSTPTANNSTAPTTATPTPANVSGAPDMASQVRINPVSFDEDWLAVSVRESDSVYETAGPFAVFSTSQPLSSARITQAPASARVLDGGRAVRVVYEDDAAPPGESSLYTLELFFEDGSTKTVDVYARRTDVSVAAAELEEYAPVLETLRERAEEHGYGTSPEALTEYLTWVNDRADLIEGFLTKAASQLFGLAIAASMNWLFWLILLGTIALVATWIKRRYGGFLEALQNDVGRSERKRRELELAYQEQKQTADEARLDEVRAVGSNSIYWEDAFGTRSPAQLARLAAFGAHERVDGDLEKRHDGVADLDAEHVEDSWLEPVLRGHRIPTAKQALGEVKAVLEWMETEHNLGHLYRDARDDVETLIRELDRREQQTFSRGDD